MTDNKTHLFTQRIKPFKYAIFEYFIQTIINKILSIEQIGHFLVVLSFLD